jgi:hypothetical protein
MWLPWRRSWRSGRAAEPDYGPPVRGPSSAYYQYFSGDFTRASKNGQLTLTTDNVVLGGAVGKDVVVPLADITEVSDQPIRRWRLYGHDSQLIIRTAYGQIGFLLADPAGWADAIRAQLGP